MLERIYIEEAIRSADFLLKCIGLKSKADFNRAKDKKINEIIGFSEHFFKILNLFNKKKDFNILECSCGKSYLSFVLNHLFRKAKVDLEPFFFGVDRNKILIDKCNKIKTELSFNNMQFIENNIIDYNTTAPIDAVIALHACDTATDQAIAKGIMLNAKYIVVVPCCQNQIRPQLKQGHSLTALTDFGLLRYRFADILTEALRSQFLRGNGYSVELKEITTSRITPKNLIIIARKKKKESKISLDLYNNLTNSFNVTPTLKELF